MQTLSSLLEAEACSVDDPGPCRLTVIDGVPYLRLGNACAIWKHLFPFQEDAAGEASLVLNTREMRFGGRRIALTRTEFRLMDYLNQAGGQLCPYEELVDSLWASRDARDGIPAIRSLVRQIRLKLRAAALPDGLLITIKGRGLKLDTRFL